MAVEQVICSIHVILPKVSHTRCSSCMEVTEQHTSYLLEHFLPSKHFTGVRLIFTAIL